MRKLSTVKAVAVVLLSLCQGLFAQITTGNLSITNYQFISEQRMTRNDFYVTYRVDLVNHGAARPASSATVSSTTPNVQILPGQGTVHFGPVPANGQVTSIDTFTISVDRSVPFDFGSLQWSFMNPVANAGANQTVTVGTMVTLNASGSSNPSGVGTLTYNWTIQSLPAGSHATISNPNSVTASVVKDTPGTLVVQLTVSNGIGQDTTLTSINTLNSPPVANAGPDQSVGIAKLVGLNGSASTDVDGDPLTYTWRFVSVPQNSAAVLSNVHSLFPTFIVDKPGTYIVQLIVNDGKVDSLPSTVNVNTINTPPVANAGPGQSVSVNALVQLNGAASTDVDGNTLTYRWSLLTVPANSTAAVSSITAVNPTFTADRPGTYVAQLIVNDGTVDSQPSTVSISTNTLQPPTANAGNNQTTGHGAPVTLNGSGTDPQNLPLTFIWAKISAPAGSAAVLSANNIAQPTFTADLPGPYVFQLITDNGLLHSAPATVTITTTNTAPVADAGANQGIAVGGTVSLDGTKSQDADHDVLTFSWSFLSRPPGSAATLIGPTSKTPTFITDVAGIYVLQLIVNDGFTASNPATVTITASTMTITLSPNPLNIALASLSPGILTVTVNPPAGPNGVPITFSGYNGSLISLLNTTVPANSTGVNVLVTALAAGTTGLMATGPGYQAGNTTVNVTSVPGTINLTSGGSVQAGQSAALNVSLAAPAPAAVTITLTSGDTSVLTVPASVSIAQGNTTPTTQPQVTGVGIGSTSVSASATGYNGAATTVKSTAILSFSTQVVSVGAGGVRSINLLLSAPAPTGGLSISLNSDNTAAATVPANVIILAGATSVAFNVTGVAAGSANISASTANPNVTGPSAPVVTTVTAANSGINVPATLTVSPGATVQYPISLASVSQFNTFIDLKVIDPSKATISPSQVVILAGQTQPGIPAFVTGVAPGPTTITATPTGSNLAPASTSITVAYSLTLSPSNLQITGNNVQGTMSLTLSAPAPPGGITFNLSSTNTAAATVFPNVTLPGGSSTIGFIVTSVAAGTADIHANAANVPDAKATVTVLPPISISVSGPANINLNQSGNLTIGLSAPAQNGATITLTSSNPVVLGVPATVTIPPGASAPLTQPQITGLNTGTANIVASAPGFTSSTSLVVNVNSSVSWIGQPLTIVGVGNTGTVTLRLNGAPTDQSQVIGVTVNLSSSDPNVVTIQSSTTYFWDGSTTPAHVLQVTATGAGTALLHAFGTNIPDATFSVTVIGGLGITTPTLGSGSINTPYSATVTAAGGTTPYTWSATGLPAGLSINPSTGAISGTPTVSGTFTPAITVTDSSSPTHLTATKTLNLNIAAGLSITTSSLGNGVVGVAYSAPVAASGGTTPYVWSATGLPNGLSIDPVSGQITGTPTAAGNSNVTVTVTDATTPTHLTASKTFPVTIAQGILITTTSPLPGGFVGQAYSAPLNATGGATPYTWTATGMPAGLTIDPSTGTISGTPTAAGSSTVTVTATDSTTPTHLSASKNFSLTITLGLSITTTSLTNGFVNTPYSAPVAATGGTTPYTWTATGLAAGLTIDPVSGQITGTPTTAGTGSVTVTVTDAATPTHATASKTFPVTINAGVSITTNALANGVVGVAYSQTMAAGGGTAPYTWSASGLPNSLSIDPVTGVISGAPVVVGTFNVTITATDSTNPSHLSASKTLSLTVSPQFAISTASLPGGFTGVAYSATMAATGGTSPYTWAATGLAAGLTIDSTTGAISGTPTAAGTSTVTISATDSTTPTHLLVARSYSVTIGQGPSITTASLPIGFVNTPYSAPVAGTGGTTPYTWSATGLPAPLTIDPTTGVVSGTPAATSTGNVTITLTDATTPTHLTVSKTLSLTINPGVSITTTGLNSAFVGVAYSSPVAATGGTPPYTWSATGLPAPLTIDPSTGVISGTPTATSNGNVTITATDATTPSHLSASKTFSLSVFAGLGITTTSLAPGFTNAAYSAPVAATGGTPNYTWSATGVPAGLTIDPTTGTISGTPTATGTSNVQVTVTDSTAPTHLTASKTFTLTINAGPSISTNSLASGFTGVAYSAPVAGSGGTPPYTWSATGLPGGLTINAGTGQISGTPTATGTSTVNITMTDSTTPTHLTASKSLSLTVNLGLSITTTALSPGFTNVVYSSTVAATGGTTPYTWSATGLAAGLTIDSNTGIISGTPTATGNSNVTITVTDATPGTHLTASTTLSLTVSNGVGIVTASPLPNGFTSVPYSVTLVAANGTTPYTWSTTALPAGLTLDPTTGVISGTPTTTGTTSFTATVTDSTTPTHLTASKTFSLTVNAPPSISTTSLANGFTGVAYSAPVAASGGTTPYTFSATGLPAGLTIDPITGTISGTPTATNAGSVTINLTDSTPGTHLTASKTLSLTINLGLSCSTASLPNGFTGTAYTAPFACTGGTTPYTYSATGLPAGLTIDPITGVISGTPTAVGTSTVNITVTDSTPGTHLTVSKALSLTVNLGLSITTNSLVTGFTGMIYNQPVAATGGTSPYTWSATGLSAGLTIDPNTGVISGTPTATNAANVTITVTDSTPGTHLTASKTLPLTINQGVSITTAALANGFTLTAYNQPVTATGGTPGYTWTATGMPAGLTIDPVTGVISGTPTATGTSSVNITVTDSTPGTHLSTSKTLSITVNTGLSINNTSLPSGFTLNGYGVTMTANGGTTPYAWSATGLPAGLTIDPVSGVISGTPTATGTSSVTITVTDATTGTHLTASKTLPLTINLGLSITTTTLPTGFTTVAYTGPVTATGGTTPYTWVATGLPAGLTIDPNTGTISGTPTATGTSSVNITVTDATPGTHLTAAATISLTVNTGLSITSTSPLTAGSVGTAYNVTVNATGGTTPYTWSATGLPAGLTIDPTLGKITGTPTAPGTVNNVTITVTDATSPTHLIVSKTFSITIAGLTITTTSLPAGNQGSSYGPVTLTATGGKTPLTWSVSGLPSALTFDPTTGIISGIPNIPSTNKSISIDVTDSSSPAQHASTVLGLTIVPLPLTITSTSPRPSVIVSQPYNDQLSATGGFTPYIWTATNLPATLTINPTTGAITGTAPSVAGAYTYTATVTDSAPNPVPVSLPFTFTVTPVFNGVISISNATVGINLQKSITVTFTPPPLVDVTLTLTSTSPGLVQLGANSNVGASQIQATITAGTGSVSTFAKALGSSGAVSIIGTIPGYQDGTGTVTLANTGFVLSANQTIGGSISTFQGQATTLTILASMLDASGHFVESQQVRPGANVQVPISSSAPTVGNVAGTIIPISAGTDNATVQFTAGTTTTGVTTVSVQSPAPYTLPATGSSISFNVQQGGPIVPSGFTIGKNLQVQRSINMLGPVAVDTVVTVTSLDSNRLQFSKTDTGASSPSITVTILAGQSSSAFFFYRALDNTGSVGYTIAVPGFPTINASVPLSPSGFIIHTPTGFGFGFSTTPGFDATLDIYTGRFDSANNFVELQDAAGGQSISVTVTSSNTTTGTITTSPISIAGGTSFSTTFFHPGTTAGSTFITASATGYTSTFVSAAVTIPNLFVDDMTVGNKLQASGTLLLTAPAPSGGVDVTFTSASSFIKFAPLPAGGHAGDPCTASGTTSLTVHVNQNLQTAGYCIYGLTTTGTATYSVTASGYNSSSATVTFAQSGIVIWGPNFCTPCTAAVSGPAQTVTVSTVVLASGASLQPLAGGSALTVPLTHSNSAVGTIPASASISGGAGSGTFSFTPTATAGSDKITPGVPSGMSTPSQFATLTFNVQ